MSSTTQSGEHTAGSVAAAISRHVVRMVAEYTGRGPNKARTTIRDNVVVCITENNMTKAEQRLVVEDEAELVDTIRRTFQMTMRDDLVAGIESITGRRVVSFLSDHDSDTDHAVEVFILDGHLRPVDPSTDGPFSGPAG